MAILNEESMPKSMYTLRTMPAHMLIDDLSRRNTEIYVYKPERKTNYL